MGKKKWRYLILWICLIGVLLAASILAGSPGGHGETIQEAMRDAVLHESNQISLFGIMNVNPGMISAFVVTAVLLMADEWIRNVTDPCFRYVSGKLEVVLEMIV